MMENNYVPTLSDLEIFTKKILLLGQISKNLSKLLKTCEQGLQTLDEVSKETSIKFQVDSIDNFQKRKNKMMSNYANFLHECITFSEKSPSVEDFENLNERLNLLQNFSVNNKDKNIWSFLKPLTKDNDWLESELGKKLQNSGAICIIKYYQMIMNTVESFLAQFDSATMESKAVVSKPESL